MRTCAKPLMPSTVGKEGGINQSINEYFWSGLSSNATARITIGVTVKKCHMIMSRNDCWNSVCFSCCRKADNELADVGRKGVSEGEVGKGVYIG